MIGSKIAGLSLLSIGGVGLIPFFTSGESERKWTIKNGNYEVASIYFTSNSVSSGTNGLLNGSWALLSNKKKEEKNLFSSAGFDIAISTENLNSSYKKPDISDNIVRILYCNRDKGDKTVAATISSVNKKIECMDLSDNWYLGFIKGKHYRAIFTVIKNGILKSNSEKSIDHLKNLTKANEEDFHENLVENLKLASGPKEKFDTEAILMNIGSSVYGEKSYSRKWCSEDRCLIWGAITDIGKENRVAENCSPNKSLKGCEIEIIDISQNTTLKSLSSFWTLGNRALSPAVF